MSAHHATEAIPSPAFARIHDAAVDLDTVLDQVNDRLTALEQAHGPALVATLRADLDPAYRLRGFLAELARTAAREHGALVDELDRERNFAAEQAQSPLRTIVNATDFCSMLVEPHRNDETTAAHTATAAGRLCVDPSCIAAEAVSGGHHHVIGGVVRPGRRPI